MSIFDETAPPIATKARQWTEYEPTGRMARCPVCDSILGTQVRYVVTESSRSTDWVPLFPPHVVPGYQHKCCESGDKATDRDHRMAS